MTHEITLNRKPNGDYQISNHGVPIGRVSNRNVHHLFYVFLDGIFFGVNQTPNRRGGSTGGSTQRLKDVPDYVASVLNTIAISDAKNAAELQALFDDVVQVNPLQASGSVLSYLVALATDRPVSIDKRGHYVATINGISFHPETDSDYILTLLNSVATSTTKLANGECWACVGLSNAYGKTIELAVLRALASNKCGGKHGDTARVPRCLLNQ